MSNSEIFENRVFTDFSEAIEGLKRFTQPDCSDRLFVYKSPSGNPSESCLCWNDFQDLGRSLRAVFRLSILGAAYVQPFSVIKKLALRAFGARIHKSVYLGPGIYIDKLFPGLLTIEEGVLMGLGTKIALHDQTRSRFRAGRVTIRRGATIGAEVLIGVGVEIGEYSTVAPGAVVLRDVPPGATVVGNPARILNQDPQNNFL